MMTRSCSKTKKWWNKKISFQGNVVGVVVDVAIVVAVLDVPVLAVIFVAVNVVVVGVVVVVVLDFAVLDVIVVVVNVVGVGMVVVVVVVAVEFGKIDLLSNENLT